MIGDKGIHCKRLLDWLDNEGFKDDIIEWAVWRVVMDVIDTTKENRREKVIDCLEKEIDKWIKNL